MLYPGMVYRRVVVVGTSRPSPDGKLLGSLVIESTWLIPA